MNFGGYQSVDSYGSYGGGGGYGGSGGGYGGGGGYFQGSQGFPSPGVGASPGVGGKGGRSGRVSTISQVTAAQIHSAVESGENDFKIDGREVGMVCLIGEVMEMNEGATTLVYKIDDRTGPWVKVQKWITEDQDPANQQERTICQEGMYVKVVGHIKTFNKQMNVTAFHIKPIVDYNEITHHLAEVMFIHLATTRGVPVPAQFQQQARQVAANQYGTPMATSTQMSSMGGGGGGGGRGMYSGGMYGGARQQHDSGLTPLQQQVLNTISQCVSDTGIDISDLVRTMGQHGHNEAKIRNAVDFLSNEGHIYSTIDENHFKSTDA